MLTGHLWQAQLQTPAANQLLHLPLCSSGDVNIHKHKEVLVRLRAGKRSRRVSLAFMRVGSFLSFSFSYN